MVNKLKGFVTSHKKMLLIAAGLLAIVLVLGGYIVWSLISWSNLDATVSGWKSRQRANISYILTMKADSDNERVEKRQSLRVLASNMNTSSLCNVHALIAWQENLSFIKPRVDSCKKKVSEIRDFSNKLTETVQYLDQEKQLTDIFSSVGRVEKVAEVDIASQPATWQAAEASLSKIDSGGVFGEVKANASDVAKGIRSAWEGVKAANDAKDRVKYEEASTTLMEAYKGLSKVSDLENRLFDSLSKDLDMKYIHIAE